MERVYNADGTFLDTLSENNVTILTANRTVAGADRKRIFQVGTDALTITLLNVAIGDEFIFQNIGADGNNILEITPESGGKFIGSVKMRQGVNADATTAGGLVSTLSAAADKKLINTKATAIKNDYIVIKKVSTTEYMVLDGLGTWVSES